ncbi:cupin domain-containing protein [Glycomyces sp. NPDC046736]|uniref:cupin domain-containing protein n=1 Tax=Glycomyces sp. NPDC046736 TaxID=3155615 RepID=UPI0033FBDF48
MRIVRATETRRTETPAAVMTTLASPTLGEAAQPVWKVEAAPGAPGPVHGIDADQVWSLIAGSVEVTVETESATLTAGDTIIVPAGAERRFAAGPDGFTALVTGPAGMHAFMPADPEKKIDLAWAA